jgi:RNA polymerase sigma-70 factor (ECF subfamily)
MPSIEPADTDELLRRVSSGDASAQAQLLTRFRERVSRMVRVRLDPRLARRTDPSDIVQEAFHDAAKKLPEYLRQRPMPFYPWLRRLAWERLVQVHRRHLHAGRRAVGREVALDMRLSDQSGMALAERFIASGTGPARQLIRAEMCNLVQDALKKLNPKDRELLILRYMEDLSNAEIAAVLQTTEASVKMRHLRAIRKLRHILKDLGSDLA